MAETDTLRDDKAIMRELSLREEISDDLVSRGRVTESRVETVSATVVEEVTINDKVRTGERPAHEYEQLEQVGVPIDERFDTPPSGYANRVVTFCDPDYSVETCSKCDGSTQTTCTSCRGDGNVTCPECSGEKRLTCENCGGDGEFECQQCADGTESCSKCSGSGSVGVYEKRQCPQCGGASRHPCPKCAGTSRNDDDDNCYTCGGEGVVDCGECRSGTVKRKVGTRDCGRCDASGRVDCSNCGGSEIDRECEECSGRGTIRCSGCRGSGTVRCDTCGGAGKVDCSKCDASGKTVTAEHGTVRYSKTADTSFDTEDIDTQFLRDGDIDAFGTHQGDTVTVDDVLPNKGESGTFREREREYTLPAKKIRYTYNGETYHAVQVGEDVRVDSYPHSTEHLTERIDEAKANSRFTSGGGTTPGQGVVGGLKLGGIEAGFTVAAALVGLIVIVIGTIAIGLAGWILDLGGTTRDVLVFGTVILAMMIAGLLRLDFAASNSFDEGTAFTVWHLLIPLAGAAAAFAAVEGGLLGPRTGLLALTFAVTVWVGVAARRTLFERHRRVYADEQATAFLTEVSADWSTLEKHGLAGQMPGGPGDVDTSRQLLCARVAYYVIWPVAAATVSLMALVFLVGFPPGITPDSLIAANGVLFGAATTLSGAARVL